MPPETPHQERARLLREVEAEGRRQCRLIGISEDGWEGETLDYSAVRDHFRRIFELDRAINAEVSRAD